MARTEAGVAVKVAGVDIGTNTTRLLIADVEAGTIVRLDRRAIVTRLGQAVDESRTLLPEAIERTVDVLAEYGEAIRGAGCEQVRAVATSAARDALNRDVFLDAAESAVGVRPVVISGDEEAALSFAGTTTGLAGAAPYLVIDPGGGSTEFVVGTGRPSYAVSVDIGSVRLTERAFPAHPALPSQVAEARSRVDELFAAEVHLPGPPGTVVGVGGTFTSLAAVHLGLLAYDSDRVHGTALALGALHDLVDRLALLTMDQTAAIPSLDPARAPVLLGGAVVAERSVRHVGAAEVMVSEHDILDGIVLSLTG